jgi:hypothetical protein
VGWIYTKKALVGRRPPELLARPWLLIGVLQYYKYLAKQVATEQKPKSFAGRRPIGSAYIKRKKKVGLRPLESAYGR